MVKTQLAFQFSELLFFYKAPKEKFLSTSVKRIYII